MRGCQSLATLGARKLHGSRTLHLARASTRVAVPVFLVFSFWVLQVECLSVYAFWCRVWSAKRDPLLKVAVRGAVCCSGAEVVQVFQGGCLVKVRRWVSKAATTSACLVWGHGAWGPSFSVITAKTLNSRPKNLHPEP